MIDKEDKISEATIYNKLPKYLLISVIIFVITIILYFFFFISINNLSSQQKLLESQIKDKEETLKELNINLEKTKMDKTKLENEIDDLLKRKKVIEDTVFRAVDSDPQMAHILPRVYIFIKNDSKKSEADKLASILEQNGYLARTIVEEKKGIMRNTIYYFAMNERKEGEKIYYLLNMKANLNADFTYYNPGPNEKIAPRRYEIWLSDNTK